MKILIYGLNYAPELIGIGKYTHEMSEWLAARGHQVKVVSSHPHYPEWKVKSEYRNHRYRREQMGDIDVMRCPLYVPERPSGARRLLSYLSFSASSTPAVIGLAARFRPDIVLSIAPSLLLAPAALLASRLCGARAWLHVQDFEIESAFTLNLLSGAPLQRCAEWIERLFLGRFDCISTISPRMIARLANKVSSPQLVEFRNWVDTAVIRPEDRPTPLRAELQVSPQSIVALYSGNMALKQGLETLIDAARLLETKRPDIVFVICGDGPKRDDLMQQSKGLANVRFLDLQPSERMSELLSTADIHLLLQRAEMADLVLPSKLAPMLASGRPILATATPGTQLAAEVDGAGVVVPAHDPPSMVAAITRLADDPALRRRLGDVGRVLAKNRWDKNAILGRLEEKLLAVADRGSIPLPIRSGEPAE
jgi:colanic acid biosynthesis glycosyl transferase WcaI